MKVTFGPTTKLGKSTLQLGAVLFILLVIIQLGGNNQVDPNYASDPVLSIQKIGAVLVAIITLITGLAAIVKSQERSMLVFIITLLGLAVIAMQD